VLEARLGLRVPSQRGGLVVACGHRVLEPAELLLGGGQVGGA
jgi:hypothetical protein